MLMKRMKECARRTDERTRQSRKRLRVDEDEQARGREQVQRPMSLVFDELLHDNKRHVSTSDTTACDDEEEEVSRSSSIAITSSLVSIARQHQRANVSLEHYLRRRCRVPLHDWQAASLQFAARREQDAEGLGTGGLMLCHQQSLGKTLISLEHTLRDNQARARATGRRFNGATLVVCKDALLLQSWMSEAASKWDGGSFFYYHLQASGNNTALDPLYLAHYCDLVFVTYSTVAFAYKYGLHLAAGGEEIETADEVAVDGDDECERRYKYDVLFGTHWRRVIADEGHLIVNTATWRYRAMLALRADLRWSVTATPSENSWHTICASLTFIGVRTGGLLDPDSDPQRPSDGELTRLMALTGVVMLRTMKRDLNLRGDSALMAFSAVTKRIRVIEFECPLEKLLYYQYAAYAQHHWNSEARPVDRTNLAYVQQMMIPLCTNLCTLPSLVLPRGMLALLPLPLARPAALFRRTGATVRDQTLTGFADRLGGPVRLSCSTEARLSAAAGYVVEYRRSLADEPVPYSKAPRGTDSVDWDPWAPSEHFDLALREHRAQYRALYRQLAQGEQPDSQGDARKQAMLEHLARRTLARDFCSTKNRHAIEYIEQTPAGDKVIVFSNSIRALHELARDLALRGVESALVCGETPKENRDRLAEFAQVPQCKVLLLSLKLGSMGLNITCANHILFLHPWWNPNVLDHAEERIQRLGQEKPMFILHFIMNNTMELYMASLAYSKQSVNASLLDKRATKRPKEGADDGALSHHFAQYRAQKLTPASTQRPLRP